FEHVFRLVLQALAKTLDLILSQGNPDFMDRLDGCEFSQCVNEDGRTSQFVELFGVSGLLLAAREVSHASAQTSSRNNHYNLHRGEQVYEWSEAQFKSARA